MILKNILLLQPPSNVAISQIFPHIRWGRFCVISDPFLCVLCLHGFFARILDRILEPL